KEEQEIQGTLKLVEVNPVHHANRFSCQGQCQPRHYRSDAHGSLSKPFHRIPQAFFQGDFRFPAQLTLTRSVRQHAPTLLPRLAGTMPLLYSGICVVSDNAEQLIDTGFDPSTDVEGAGSGILHG